MSVILFLLVLFVLVLVHEWGHFIVAKKTGMRVDEFGIGFPPKLFSVKKGETEYTFNALPIGGFVRIWGENGEEPFSPVESEASDRRSETSVEAGEGGTRSNLASKAVDYSRSFSARPKWAQALVLIAGVTMNILFAWLLFTVTFMIGSPTTVDEPVATDAAELYVMDVLPDSPAAVIPAGSVITSIESSTGKIDTPTPTEFSQFVVSTAPESVKISYTYGNESQTVDVTPVQGMDTKDPERYLVGASLSLVEVVKKPFLIALRDGSISTYNGFIGIADGLFTLLKETVVGKADFSQVAGPVGIVGMVGDAASFGIVALLTFTAFISLNLAVINLLPFPALDGGRLVFVAIEAVTGRQIPHVWAGRVNLLGFALLMILMIVVTYNDIVRLFIN